VSCVQSLFNRKSLLVQQKNLYSNKVCRLSSCSTIKQNLRTVMRTHHLQTMAESCSKSWLVPAIFRESLKMHKDFAKLQLLAPAISGASTSCRIWVVRVLRIWVVRTLWFWRLFDLWWPNITKRNEVVLRASATSSCRNAHLLHHLMQVLHLIFDTRHTEILWGSSGAEAVDDPSDFGDFSLLDLQSCTSEKTRSK